jgi:two-component system chemotaxis response regulator CheV
VSKVVSELTDFTRVPESHPAVRGIFKDMGRLVPVVDLPALLGLHVEENHPRKVIVTEFFGLQTGFWAQRIDWIHHFKWEDVIDSEQVFFNIPHKYTIGIVKPTEERMVQLLDYERILLDLCPHLGVQNIADHSAEVDLASRRILIAEDSPAVRSMLEAELCDMGAEVVTAPDGARAWEMFQQQSFELVICDVEMPRMDGLALTLQIRQSERSETPVIVYSSIGDVGMKARASFLRADAHITKLNIDRLLKTADALMRGERPQPEDDEAAAEHGAIESLVAVD